jgi:hypothetical protein
MSARKREQIAVSVRDSQTSAFVERVWRVVATNRFGLQFISYRGKWHVLYHTQRGYVIFV